MSKIKNIKKLRIFKQNPRLNDVKLQNMELKMFQVTVNFKIEKLKQILTISSLKIKNILIILICAFITTTTITKQAVF